MLHDRQVLLLPWLNVVVCAASDTLAAAAASEPRIPVDRNDPQFLAFMAMLSARPRMERASSATLSKVLEWVASDRMGFSRVQVVSFLSVSANAAGLLFYLV